MRPPHPLKEAPLPPPQKSIFLNKMSINGMDMSENRKTKFSDVEVNLGSFKGGFKILKQCYSPAYDGGKSASPLPADPPEHVFS